jgi:hypothetical protein
MHPSVANSSETEPRPTETNSTWAFTCFTEAYLVSIGATDNKLTTNPTIAPKGAPLGPKPHPIFLRGGVQALEPAKQRHPRTRRNHPTPRSHPTSRINL